jgi:hypothetical protein
MKQSAAFGKVCLWGTISLFGIFYFQNLPHFVQGGDTGELVAAAYQRFVPHPPGYPLWMWMEYCFTHLVSVGSIFWRASLLCSLLACFTLALIGLPLLQNSIGAFTCLSMLGLSTPFLEAALMPDVFSLHGLIVTGIGSLYLFADPASKQVRLGIPFLFCLGLAHHLTLLFLLPVLMHRVFEEIRPTHHRREGALQQTLLALLAGCVITLVLYSSLMSMHPESPFSWGTITDLKSVWNHFLRSDYGSFQLSPMGQTAGLGGILFFFRSTWAHWAGIFSFLLISRFKKEIFQLNRRVWIWTFTCLLSIAFFGFSNITPLGMGQEVLSRFCVMPLVQLTLLWVFLVRQTDSRHIWVLFGPCFVLCGVLCLNATHSTGLSHDSTLQDYAANFLGQAQNYEPAVILTENDSAYFALRYVQAMEGIGQSTVVASPSLFFHPWYVTKTQAVLPAFQLRNSANIWRTRRLQLEKDLIEPNARELALIVSHGYSDGQHFSTRFLGLGRVLRPGTGVEFDSSSLHKITLHTHHAIPPRGPSSFSKGLLYSEYAHFFLAQGLAHLTEKKPEEAQNDFHLALEAVPFALPAWTHLCQLSQGRDPQCTPARLEQLQKQSRGLF